MESGLNVELSYLSKLNFMLDKREIVHYLYLYEPAANCEAGTDHSNARGR